LVSQSRITTSPLQSDLRCFLLRPPSCSKCNYIKACCSEQCRPDCLMKNSLAELSPSTLRRAADLKEEIEALQNELSQLLGAPIGAASSAGPKKRFSAASRAKMAQSQRERWARMKGPAVENPQKQQRRVSAALRKARSLAAKARWDKAKAAGRTRL
jgi:hypothetical protein